MGGPVAWIVNREKKPSRSSCEAEIHAVDEGCRLTEYARFLLEELGEPEASAPVPLYNDNQGTVDWSATCCVNKRLRHMNIREITVLQSKLDGTVDIRHIPGRHNPSDLFTKEHKDDTHFAFVRDILVVARDP